MSGGGITEGVVEQAALDWFHSLGYATLSGAVLAPAGTAPERTTSLAEAEAFKRRVDDQLALGDYRPTSTTTFATCAADWIDAWPLKDQTRARYRGILPPRAAAGLRPAAAGEDPSALRPELGGRAVAGPLSASSVRQYIAVLRRCLKAAQIDGTSRRCRCSA